MEVVVKSDGEAEVTSGVSELSLLKTTQVKNSSTCIMWSTMCRVTDLYLESLTMPLNSKMSCELDRSDLFSSLEV